MINTLKLARELQEAGFTQLQSEKLAETLLGAQSDYLTRDYLDAKLQALKTELLERINSLKGELTNKISGLIRPVVIIGIITWLLQIFGAEVRNLVAQLLQHLK